jgi:hypothetical protein
MASFGDVFGEGSVAYQMFIYGVVQRVIEALAAPGFTELEIAVNKATTVQPLSPADAAVAANRSFLDLESAQAEAAAGGYSADRFTVLQHLAGNAPAPEELATALRRSIIPADGSGPDAVSFTQGIAEGNLLDKWGPVIQKLAQAIPSPADIVDAMVKGQVTESDATALFTLVGGDPDYFDLLVNIAGNPPSPTELLQLAQRGIIPWNGTGPDATTFEQGFYEGRSKDKWEPIYQNLATYWPTASEVIELYRWGEIDQPTATSMLAQRGLNPQQAAWWIGYANANAVDDYRGLTVTAVLAMLSVSYITDDQATTMMQAMHYGPDAIAELINYGHIQRAIQSVNDAVSRIGNLYQGRKITQATAIDALTQVGVPASAIQDVIADWNAVASINVATLTYSQIGDAFKYSVIDQDTAMQELINIGYTPYDAWVTLSVYNEGPLPGQPEPGPAAPLGAVIPGTT